MIAGIAVALYGGTVLAQQSIDTMSSGVANDDFRNNLAVSASGFVCQHLRECDSAQFRVILVHRLGQPPAGEMSRGDDGYSVCGVVNAKNGFGGYSGDTRYVFATAVWKHVSDALPDHGVWFMVDKATDDGTSDFNKVWQAYCW